MTSTRLDGAPEAADAATYIGANQVPRDGEFPRIPRVHGRHVTRAERMHRHIVAGVVLLLAVCAAVWLVRRSQEVPDVRPATYTCPVTDLRSTT